MKNFLLKCFLIAGALLVVVESSKAQSKSDPAFSIEDNFIVTPLSFDAMTKGIGVSINYSSAELTDFEQLPPEFKLADLTGYLIVIDKSSVNFKKLNKLLKDEHYIPRGKVNPSHERFILSLTCSTNRLNRLMLFSMVKRPMSSVTILISGVY